MSEKTFFNGSFTATQLAEHMNEKYPDAFGIEIYKDKAPNLGLRRGVNLDDMDKELAVFSRLWKKPDDGARYTLYWPETCYTTTDQYKNFQPRFEVYSGDENTYIRFMLERDSDCYVATWGYKRCDVERNYLIELIDEMYSKTLDYKF